MKNRAIGIFLILMGLFIGGVIILEFLSKRPGQLQPNPYELDVDSLAKVDDELVIYREIRNLKLPLENPAGISYLHGKLVVTGDRELIALDTQGKVLMRKSLDMEPVCVKATESGFYLGATNRVEVFDTTGVNRFSLDDFHENSMITSVDVFEDKIFIADAGRRVVYRFNVTGEKELEIDGRTEGDNAHGFIVPSPNFDLAVNNFGELWIVNPGKHALENYSPEGKLRGWWTSSFSDVKGFSGCCNPAHFTFLPDGNFITSEKGVVRIKEYKPSGEFVGVVAPPAKFQEQEHAPDVVADENSTVYALDKHKKMIRVFVKN